MNRTHLEPELDCRQELDPVRARRPYEAPRLSDLGSLGELTKGGGHTGHDEPGIPIGLRPD
jgi:hypothetical protein